MGEKMSIHEIHLHRGEFTDVGPHWVDQVKAFIAENVEDLRKDHGEDEAHLH